MNEARLTIKIEHSLPVELVDFTKGLTGLADEYRRFVKLQSGLAITDDVKLYIKEIRSGSIITDLVALSASGLPFIENTVSVLDFSKYLAVAFNFLTGKSAERPAFTKQNLENINQLLEPIAKDNAAQFNCNTTINGDVHLTINMSSLEAKAAQHSADREMKAMKDPVTGYHEMVVLYWYQARNDMAGGTGDKAIIESIQRYPVKTICATPETKAAMIRDQGNPFTSAFLVDLNVETIDDKPVLYKVTKVHELLPLPEGHSQK